MKKLLLSLLLMTNSAFATDIFTFNKNANTDNWSIVNDGVMGGLSQGGFQLDDTGKGLFTGRVSLENNGGFTMLCYKFSSINIGKTAKKAIITLKGDGKDYQFRLKEKADDRVSYVGHFKTIGTWETIEINLADMYPAFHGFNLPTPNFSHDSISELGFLIANKKAESFQLQIASIVIK